MIRERGEEGGIGVEVVDRDLLMECMFGGREED